MLTTIISTTRTMTGARAAANKASLPYLRWPLERATEASGAVLWVGRYHPTRKLREALRGAPRPFARLSYHRAASDRTILATGALSLAKWIIKHKVRTMLVVTDLEDHNPGIEGFTEQLILSAIRELKWPGCLTRILTKEKTPPGKRARRG